VLDHVSLPVSNLERSKRFYEEALSPLGHELIMEHRISGVGIGQSGKPDFRCGQLANDVLAGGRLWHGSSYPKKDLQEHGICSPDRRCFLWSSVLIEQSNGP
jgi:catechol 2,3-dioxygenase-like lactoylglutathione lyase family enzyme